MALKLKFRTLFPASVTASSPLTLVKTGLAYVFGLDMDAISAELAVSFLANPSSTIGLTANNGSASTAMRSDATPALSQAIEPTWTAAHRFVPSATGFQQPLYSQTSLSGSGAAPTGITPNLFYIPGDTYDAGGNFVSGVQVSHSFGGAATKGGRIGFFSSLGLTSPTHVDNPNRNYVGLQGTGYATSGDGGTDTGAGAKGAVFGIGAHGYLHAGVTNALNVTGGEADVTVEAGSTVRFKTGWQISSHHLDVVAGVDVDAGLSITRQVGGIGFRYAVDFSDFGGLGPTTATGTLVGATNPLGTTLTAANGVDLRNYAFSNLAFASNGISVDGVGNISAPTITLTGNGVSSPIVNGGVAVNSSLLLYSTFGVGTTDFVEVRVGNAGATKAGRFTHNGGLAVGPTAIAAGDPGAGIVAATGFTGAWNGTTIPVAKGGTGATTSAGVQALVQPGLMYTAPVTVNFNSANTDTAIPFTLPTGMTRILGWRVHVYGATASLTAANFGIFPATVGAGTALIGAGSTLTITTGTDSSANNAQSNALTQATTYVAASLATPNTVYFRVGTAVGSAATAQVVIEYYPLP